MPDLSDLYYQEKNAATQFSSVPQGILNVFRMVQGKSAYWQKLTPENQTKPKQIIFADWSIKSWDNQKKDKARDKFKRLLADGFTLYIWQDGHLEKMTDPDRLLNPDVQNKITPAHFDEILKAGARAHKLTFDNSYIIDDHRQNLLLGYPIDAPRQLNLVHFFEQNTENQEKIAQILQQSNPPVVEMLIDRLGFNTSSLRTKAQKKWPNLVLVEKYHALYCRLSLNDVLPSTSQLEEMQRAFIEENMAETVALNIERSDPAFTEMLTNISKFQTAVHALNASNIHFKYLNPLNFTKLESIDFSKVEAVDISLYPDLIHILSQLKHITLSETDFIAGNIENIHTDNLETLKIKNMKKISSELLSRFLSSATNLSELFLEQCEFHQPLDNKLHLPHLKTLNLLNSTLDKENYRILFKAAQHLQHLSCNLPIAKVDYYYYADNKLSRGYGLDSANFSQLESFTSSSGGLQWEILKKAPKLRKIALSNCNLAKRGNLEPLELSQLESLSLQHVNIHESQIHNILKSSAQTLHYLDLSHSCAFLDKDEKKADLIPDYAWIDDFKLEQLETLKIVGDSSEMSGIIVDELQIIKHIIQQAPNLKTIQLNKHFFADITEINWEMSWLADCHLPQLEEFDIAELNCNLALSCLNQFLKQTPNLKQLNLSKYQGIENMPLNAEFTQLVMLDLSNTNISINALKNTLRRMPNLKYLSIKECEHIVVDQELQALFDKIAVVEQAPKRIVRATYKQGGYHQKTGKNIIYEDAIDASQQTGMSNSQTNPQQTNKKTEPTQLNSQERVASPDSVAHTLQKNPTQNTANIQNDTATQPSIPQAQRPNQQSSVDADTTHKDKTYNLSRIFFSPFDDHHPAIEHYRIQTFDSVTLTPNLTLEKNPFLLVNTAEVDLQPVEINQVTEDVMQFASKKSIYGKQQLVLNQEWQAIASLSAIEKMTHFHILPKVDIELQYSARDNLYYIRTANPMLVTLDFLIEPSPFIEPELTQDIQAVVNTFRAFQDRTLKMDKANPQSIDYLNAILSQKTGACRHRAAAFKLYMEKNHPQTPVRIVSNQCHMFVEIKQNDKWILTDLGGYSAKMNINDSLMPKVTTEVAQPKEKHVSKSTPKELEYFTTRQKKFQKTFETWNRKKNIPPANSTAFIHSLIHDQTKHLIELPRDHIQALNLELQAYAQRNHHPVFYIHSPDDLICSAPFVKHLPDHTGIIQNGPGGPLYDFLTMPRKEGDNTPLIIVNYANFLADDIVRFNSLLDNTRKADGTLVPENTRILGLIDPKKPGSYQGGDFYSRFQAVHQCPVSLIPSIEPVLKPLPDVAPKCTIINLCHSSAWETELLGGWTLKAGKLYFEEGELIQALKKGVPIEIQNPPNEAAFDLFWQQARLNQCIQSQGETIPFNDNQMIFYSEGYHWNDLLNDISWVETPVSTANILNPTLLNRYINNYQFNNNQLSKFPGILQNYANARIDIFLTHSMSEDQWGLLLEESKKYHVHLSIACARGVLLPDGFPSISIPNTPKLQAFNPTHLNKTMAIKSKDCDLTIATLQSQSLEDPFIVIDVSELTESDLLKKIDGKLIKREQNNTYDNEQYYDFQFTETPKILLNALNDSKKIILTGHFSNELLEGLAPFLRDRTINNDAKGQLVIVQNESIPFLTSLEHHIAPEDKIHMLQNDGFTQEEFARIEQENPNYLTNYDYNELKTRLLFLKRYPKLHSDEAWHGFETLPSHITLKPFNPRTSYQITQEFVNQRRIAILDALQLNREKPHAPLTQKNSTPYVFLAGLTGVGKTTFVEDMFTTRDSILFQSDKKILDWATCDESGNKILFIDEANLTNTQWSQFEGLFHEPPSVLIDGQRYPLSPQHKIIFAGNPLSYGDERQVARLFKRHGNALVFDPLPTAFIYETIIKPIFNKSPLSTLEIEEMSQELLAVYQFVADCSRHDVLISPREVQMMALLVNQHLNQHPHLNHQDKIHVAQYYAKSIALSLIPETHLTRFNQKFPDRAISKSAIPVKYISEKSNAFVQTPSRDNTLHKLHDFISLQSMRRNDSTLNDAQAYGGLGGLIIEGAPGIGKSEMVIDYLVSQGIHEADITTSHSYDNQMFYRIPVSMELDAKKRLLLKAFNEGAIVIIDEINSAPMMEQLLNSLLMGKTPEGNRPQRAGFAVIGTQNPSTMAGRRMSSSALSRRMQTCYLSAYTDDETIHILQHKGVQTFIAEELLQAFQLQAQIASKAHLKPAPTFRDLINAAEDWVTAHGKVSMSDMAPRVKYSTPTPLTSLPDPYRLTNEQTIRVAQQIDDLLNDFLNNLNTLHLDNHLQTITSQLQNALLEKKNTFLSEPSFDNFERFKTESAALIDTTEKISHFNHTVFTTPVLRELTMLLRGLKHLIQLLVLKPVYILSGRKDPVFTQGLYAAFFTPPKTDMTEETHLLREGIDKLNKQV